MDQDKTSSGQICPPPGTDPKFKIPVQIGLKATKFQRDPTINKIGFWGVGSGGEKKLKNLCDFTTGF